MINSTPLSESVQVIDKVILRPTATRPVSPGIRPPSGTHYQFFFLSLELFSDTCVLWYGKPSLTRGRICNLIVQVLLGLASAVTLRSNSRGTSEHILLSYLRLCSPFVASYDSQGYSGGILTSLHMWLNLSTDLSGLKGLRTNRV
jgi:hypothetical protein